MFGLLLLKIIPCLSDVTIDLSKATLDEESGNYCVVQKVGRVCLITKGLCSTFNIIADSKSYLLIFRCCAQLYKSLCQTIFQS